jgi:hypothetical protein
VLLFVAASDTVPVPPAATNANPMVTVADAPAASVVELGDTVQVDVRPPPLQVGVNVTGADTYPVLEMVKVALPAWPAVPCTEAAFALVATCGGGGAAVTVVLPDAYCHHVSEFHTLSVTVPVPPAGPVWIVTFTEPEAVGASEAGAPAATPHDDATPSQLTV